MAAAAEIYISVRPDIRRIFPGYIHRIMFKKRISAGYPSEIRADGYTNFGPRGFEPRRRRIRKQTVCYQLEEEYTTNQYFPPRPILTNPLSCHKHRGGHSKANLSSPPLYPLQHKHITFRHEPVYVGWFCLFYL